MLTCTILAESTYSGEQFTHRMPPFGLPERRTHIHRSHKGANKATVGKAVEDKNNYAENEILHL